MSDPLITLTTDFGEDSPYVAAMKGVILTLNPAARLLDLSHQIPPQDLRHTAFFLKEAIPYFPPGTLHVIVVDPGVGTERKLLYVEVDRQRLLVPDNGCWTLLAASARPERVIALAEPRYWRQTVSSTFHGRDILAPVAGHLSKGLDPVKLGTAVSTWVQLDWQEARFHEQGIAGQVAFVDHFGNLITNIPGDQVPVRPAALTVGRRTWRRGLPRVRTYGEASPGKLVWLVSSQGWLEIAVAGGNAASKLRAAVGTAVSLNWLKR